MKISKMNFALISSVFLLPSLIGMSLAHAQMGETRIDANRVGNGGAVAFCSDLPSDIFDKDIFFKDGYFTVDHITNRSLLGPKVRDFLDNNTYETVLEKISELLAPLPNLQKSLKTFIRQFEKVGLPLWFKNIPKNCQGSKENVLYFPVILVKSSGGYVYHYDPKMISNLKENRSELS